MSYLDDLSDKKQSASEEQKHSDLINAVANSGERVVKAVSGSSKDIAKSVQELLLTTLLSKDPKISEASKKLVLLVDEINKATSSIKDANFKPLAENLKTLQATLADIPSQIEEAHKASNVDERLAEIATKIGKQKFDPKITVESPKLDLSPITKVITGVEKVLKDFKVDIPETNLDSLREEMQGVKKAINGLSFPVPNYVLPFKSPTDGKATQVVLDSSGNVPVSGTISVDTTGLATSAKQDTGNTSLSSIDGKITAVNTGAVVVSSSALPSGAATSAKQDTGNTSVGSIDTKMTDGSQKTQIVDAGGEAVTVTGGKLDVNATISGASGGTSSIDDAAFTAASDSGTPMMGFASADTVDSGDVGVLAMDTSRNLKVIAQSNSGVDIGDVTINNASGASAVNIQDGGNSITVDYATTGSGTATGALRVELPTNGTGTVGLNAGTNAIGKLAANSGVDIGDVDILSIAAGDNNIGNVDIVTVPADPFGANADAAATAGGTGSIQAKLRNLTSTNDSIKTAVETIDNAISGNEMQVDVVAALPAGTNAIGKLAANSGVDIGDVDVTSAVSATLDHGSNRDIDTTAEQITSTSFACKFGVTLTADASNTGILYIGNSDVTAGTTAATDGIPLAAGDSITLPVTNSNIPYAIGSANNQIIYWIAV